MNAGDHEFHDELQAVIDRLEAERPTATALELDDVKRRVLSRMASRPRGRTQGIMRSRATILATLVLGVLLSTSGAGLAISGFADNDQAAVAQYGTGNVGGNAGGKPGAKPGGAVLPGSQTNPRPNAQVQPGLQAERVLAAQKGGALPFTGFAAIPVLLIGIVLLSAGLVLRRTGRRA